MTCCTARKLTNKTLVTFMILIVLSLGMTACGDKTPSEKAKAAGDAVGDAAKATGDAVGDAAKATGDAVGDAMQATGEFLTQSKETDVKAAQETLDVIEKKWQDLLAEAAPSTDEAKVEFQNAKDQMAETLAKAKANLVEAENASGDDWQQNVKPALDAALQKAQKLYEDASARFGSK
jgi:predicted small lipoprotein YifL